MPENNEDFIARLQKEQEERREQAASRFEETKILKLEVGNLYKFEITRAWGKQDDQYGDFMGFSFTPESPVTKGYKGDENTVYVRSGIMRTLRQRVLRDLGDNDDYPELEAGFSDGEAILVKVPKVENPVKVQFVVVEEEPKGGNKFGFQHVFGEPVEDFDDKWEKSGKFVERIQKERDEYLASKRESASEDDEGEKIGHEELGVNEPFHVHITRVYAPKDAEPGYMIFRLDKEKSELGNGLDKGNYNRMHLSGVTLKTFLRILSLPPRDGGAMVQVGFDAENKQPEYAKLPQIPADGVSVKFFRQERQSADYSYKECLGEVIQ